MKKIVFFATIFGLLLTNSLMSQTVLGKWKTIDDETGKPKSIVEIYEKSGKVYGKVIEILDPKKKDNLCQNCTGEDKNKPVLGMHVVKNMKKDNDEYSGGTITDPNNGKVYKCLMSLESKDKLKVRGFIGFSLIGRTQIWHRVK